MSEVQYPTSKLVVLQQPQKLKEVSQMWLVLLFRWVVLRLGSQRGIEGARRAFGDAAPVIAAFSEPLRFPCQTQPSQTLLPLEHVRLSRPWYRSYELLRKQLEHDREPTPTPTVSLQLVTARSPASLGRLTDIRGEDSMAKEGRC